MFNRSILVISVFVLGAVTASAAPKIRDAEGTFLHGKIIEITGVGFGVNKNPAPWIWDNMESGKLQSSWKSVHHLKVSKKFQRHQLSKFNSHLNFTGNFYDGHFLAKKKNVPRWFIQYWFMVSRNWDWGTTDKAGNERFLSKIKILRLWDPQAPKEELVVSLDGEKNEILFSILGLSNPVGGVISTDMRKTLAKGAWHLFQMEFSEDSGGASPDGNVRIWIDGKKQADLSRVKTRGTKKVYKQPYVIGFSDTWGPNTDEGELDREPNDFYMDDVYVDVSWARVELGDRRRYEDCTHREIQLAKKWSGRTIQFELNLGSFEKGDTVFIFVRDKNGNVNEQGFPLTVGKSGHLSFLARPSPRLKPDTTFISYEEDEPIIFGEDAFEIRVYDPSGTHLLTKVRKKSALLRWDGRGSKGQELLPEAYLCKILSPWGDVIFQSILVEP